MKRFIKLIYLTVLFSSLFACDPNRVFEDNVDMEGDYWHKDSLVQFQFTIPEATIKYNLYSNIRNAHDYPFYNLYYQYTIKDSVDQIVKEELININLFDPKTGEPFGSGLGDLFDHQKLILGDYFFPSAGDYSITFEQYMRKDELPLILSMGVRVELSE